MLLRARAEGEVSFQAKGERLAVDRERDKLRLLIDRRALAAHFCRGPDGLRVNAKDPSKAHRHILPGRHEQGVAVSIADGVRSKADVRQVDPILAGIRNRLTEVFMRVRDENVHHIAGVGVRSELWQKLCEIGIAHAVDGLLREIP